MASKPAAVKARPARASKATTAPTRSSTRHPRAAVAAPDREPPPDAPTQGAHPSRKVGASTKRKGDESYDPKAHAGQRPFKKAKTAAKPRATKEGATTTPAASHAPALPIINQPPTQALTVLVFGNGECGELGLGPKRTEVTRPCVNPHLDPKDPHKFRVVQLACGGMHVIALTADNRLITWGVNDEHALGRDTSWDEPLRDVDAASDDEDGDLNPLEATPTEIPATHFPPGTRFVQVAAADSCSLALTDTGLVFGCGTFRDPQGNTHFGYGPDGSVVKKQATPVLIPGLEKITQIVCGANHALALDSDGSIWAWGSNSQNQFGRRLFGRHEESLEPRLVRVCRKKAKYVASGEYHAFAVDQDDNVWGWGMNSFGEAGHADTAGDDSAVLPYPVKIPDLCGKRVVSLSGGGQHSAALTADGQCLVWGRLDDGQLGIDFAPEQLQDPRRVRCNERGQPRICLRPTAVPHIGTVVHVACGARHTVFINAEGEVYATGFGPGGQLGLGPDNTELKVAQRVQGHVKGRVVTWAGAGTTFSIVAEPA